MDDVSEKKRNMWKWGWDIVLHGMFCSMGPFMLTT